MPPEMRLLPSTSKTSPGRRVSSKAVESFGVNGSQWLAGFCNQAIKRPTLSNIQPMTRSSPFLVLVFSRLAVPDSSPAVRSPKLHPKRNHREMDRTIAPRVIRTLHSLGLATWGVATDGNVAPRSAAARPTVQEMTDPVLSS